MNKKLPKVFVNQKQNSDGNNKKMHYSSNEEEKEIKQNKEPEKNINQKINSIFKSSNYIYKADVEVTTKEGIKTKRIIGKTRTHLITYDNELIPLTEIIDIKRK